MSPTVRDVPALVAALVILALGTLLLLDATEAISLRLAVLPPLFLAVVGAILVAIGVDGRNPGTGPPA